MIGRALNAGVPCAWVSGDAVYGSAPSLRVDLEGRHQPYVLAVASTERLGGVRSPSEVADTAGDWRRSSAGDGAKGQRLYDWALVDLTPEPVTPESQLWGHYLLARRSVHDPSERAYYAVFARQTEASVERLAVVAGTRWQIEVGFEAAKQECGLDEYEVRGWTAWHRHVTLSLLAHAFLVALQAEERKKGA